ncbi:uncharacterized protein L969DRAFT_49845 [Mixia osmundae IAM 14324]|uniref:Ribosomal protein S21 n=1 Tax=Mixia osmundae (strain CBS 9802 / IAM 14324 / JCM 22182 / KY 12970) TaxID=764103 RepID=G7DYX0_MIXOS|nr:uncharacterized protein L969DRAFT_49845 [Mixia osmundae IAM 14324]KEI38611.1 hypothetical protein L969DRAFT_49845 [Mixia osmundae IAM 14324]GAA95780.1 hypothetical protein E5Q_02437 [Mixia osmundae IAM 14324]
MRCSCIARWKATSGVWQPVSPAPRLTSQQVLDTVRASAPGEQKVPIRGDESDLPSFSGLAPRRGPRIEAYKPAHLQAQESSRSGGFTRRTPDELWKAASAPSTVQHAISPVMPATSRSVEVRGDLSRTYANLRGILNKSDIRSELRLQERYEKPKFTRQRLKSERHRRRFGAAVSEKVGAVLLMKSRGM